MIWKEKRECRNTKWVGKDMAPRSKSEVIRGRGDPYQASATDRE